MARRRIWTVDALEGREMLSLTPVLGLIGPKVVATSTSIAGSTISASADTSDQGGSGITNDTSPPRPNEVARRTFKASFSGRVVELPPRLYDQARQFYILAPGNTNQFLHGTLQMRYYTPELSSGATTTTGTISMSDRSTQSGAVILANLTGDPTQVDARGRPKHFDFVVNGGGGSGGIYASSVGSGTLDISYQGNKAKVVVRGSIFTLGIGQPLAVMQSSTNH